MDFMRKRFSSVFGILLYLAIILTAIFLFIWILPFVLLLGVVIWLVFKVVKIIKVRDKNKENVFNSMNDIEVDYNVDMDNSTSSQIIDVEYKDVE